MTADKIALRELLEKGSDGSFLREMIGFAAERLMALETEELCGAAPGEGSVRISPPRRLVWVAPPYPPPPPLFLGSAGSRFFVPA